MSNSPAKAILLILSLSDMFEPNTEADNAMQTININGERKRVVRIKDPSLIIPNMVRRNKNNIAIGNIRR